MLYSEFIQGTGCKDNEHNYEVYRNLEVMYMNSDLSKDVIYEYGKKLVDNSKSEKELEVEAGIKAEIESIEAEIKSAKEWQKYYKAQKEYNKSVGDKFWEKENRRMEQYYTDEIKQLRNRIAGLKWVLAA